MSNLEQIISINITQFPQNLLIPGIENRISLQAINNSNKSEIFKFTFEGENLKISLESDKSHEKIEFSPGETKNIDFTLESKIDGFGKLKIDAYWLNIIESLVKVQKIRESVKTQRFEKIVDKYTLTTTETIEKLNPDEFFIEMTKEELNQAEQALKLMRKQHKSSGSAANAENSPVIVIEDIDAKIGILAKGYLSDKDPLRALKLALTLSEKEDQIALYYNLARAYGMKYLQELIEVINKIKDSKVQQKILKLVTLDHIFINPKQAIKVSLLIKDKVSKESLLDTIFGKVIESNPVQVLYLTKEIEDLILKFKYLLNAVKKLLDKDEKSEIFNILSLAIKEVIDFIELHQNNKKDKTIGIDLLKDGLLALAEIEGPKAADSIIESIHSEELKETVVKDLFDEIYVIVEEVRIKIESHLVYSQFYILNTYVSAINDDVKKFSLANGNLSNNLLLNDFSFNSIFLSLFGFTFSLFPILDRVYNDLKYNHNKSFAYYIFPSKNNYDENEEKILRTTLRQFFKKVINTQTQIVIFNLDFIPYLGKPTVILSSTPEINDLIHTKLKKIGDIINVNIDNSLFQGGKIYEYLQDIFPSNAVKIVNLVLSYEFINDYNVLKTVLQFLL